jgi:hypothetical protein
MLSSFFTLSENLKMGVEVSWKRANYIAVGGAPEGLKVPVASRRKIERVLHGTISLSPKLRIEPIETPPLTEEPHAVVLLRSFDIPSEHGWKPFGLPESLMPKGGKKASAPVKQIAGGFEVVENRERAALLLALPPNSAIELPYMSSKVLVWLGKGYPALVNKGVLKHVKRSA